MYFNPEVYFCYFGFSFSQEMCLHKAFSTHPALSLSANVLTMMQTIFNNLLQMNQIYYEVLERVLSLEEDQACRLRRREGQKCDQTVLCTDNNSPHPHTSFYCQVYSRIQVSLHYLQDLIHIQTNAVRNSFSRSSFQCFAYLVSVTKAAIFQGHPHYSQWLTTRIESNTIHFGTKMHFTGDQFQISPVALSMG